MIKEIDVYEVLRNAEFSEAISAILNYLDDTKSAFYANYDEVNRQDLLSTDRSHQLELKDMTDEELLLWARRHRDELKERREVKDAVMKATPLVEFIESDSWESASKDLRKVLGQLRTVEQKMQTRMYHYRVLDDGDVYIKPKPMDETIDGDDTDEVAA